MNTSIASNSSIYAGLGLTGNAGSIGAANAAAAAAASSQQLGQEDFLRLMTVQLRDQDPLNPVSNNEFFSQVAQFSTVSGISQLNGSFASLSSQLSSSQSLQAANLIGHRVVVPGSEAQLTGAGLWGAVEVPASGSVVVKIQDASGALVRSLDLGVQPAGNLPFSWDGKDAGGNQLAPGSFKISAQVGTGSNARAATTDVLSMVQSVLVGPGGLTLDLSYLGEVPLSSVRQIL